MDLKLVIQPNRLTMARYHYSVYEKRLLYQVIKMLQKEMKGEISIPTSDYGDRYFLISLSDVEPSRKNPIMIRRAFQTLLDKRISIDIDEEGSGFEGRIINWGELRQGVITLSLPSKVIPSLTDVAKGFTNYDVLVAMSFQSAYSMRLYEFISRFKDTGFWYTTPDDLREMLGLLTQPGYTKYNNLKTRVLEVAKKEMQQLYDKDECDLTFTYTEHREGKGRGGQVKKLTFRILNKKKAHKMETSHSQRSEAYLYVANFLTSYYEDSARPFITKVLTCIADDDRLATRVAEIAKKAVQKGDRPAAFFRSVLGNELGIVVLSKKEEKL